VEQSIKKKKHIFKAKIHSSKKWLLIHKTETIFDNQNPAWAPFQISIQPLCNGSFDQPFLIECLDWDNSGNHDLIGRATVTLRELQVMKEIKIINPNRVGLTNVAGTLHILKCKPLG